MRAIQYEIICRL